MARSFSCRRGFALLLLLLWIATTSALLSALVSLFRYTSSRAQLSAYREIAKANAYAALRLALRDLSATLSSWNVVTATADLLIDCSPELSHWTGVWRVEPSGRPLFLRWLVSGPDSDSLELPCRPLATSVACLTDYDLPDRCPSCPVQDSEKTCGHYAYWIGDEGVKARVNDAPPNIVCRDVLQQIDFPPLTNLPSSAHRSWVTERCFAELVRRLAISPALFHSVTLSSAGVLADSKSGDFLQDLTTKIASSETAPEEFLFPPQDELPQPPPTFGLLVSYFHDFAPLIRSGAPLPVRPIGPAYRFQLPSEPQFPLSLPDLALSNGSYQLPTNYGAFPVLLDFSLTVSARAVGERIEIFLRPLIALWNPLDQPLLMTDYVFRLLAADRETRAGADGSLMLPGFSVGRETCCPWGSQDGVIFSARFSSDFRPGEVKYFSLPADSFLIDPTLPEMMPFLEQVPDVEPAGALTFFLLDKKNNQTICRLNDPSRRVGWFNLALQLNLASGRCLQEVLDFVNGDVSQTYDLAGGEIRPLFRLSARLPVSEPDDFTRRNPFAPQFRRTYYESWCPFGEDSARFSRRFPAWQVALQNYPWPVMQLVSSPPVRLAYPPYLFSIACLNSLNLSPFGHHHFFAIGNSFAPDFLIDDSVWSVAEPEKDYNRSASSLKTEMRIDYSYLLNESLFDHYFVSGIETSCLPKFSSFTNCFIVDRNCYSELKNSKSASRHLLNGGAFNVNSTNVNSWNLLINSYRNYQLSCEKTSFARPLTPEKAASLARSIVAEVRVRGPFGSLSQFLNRCPGSPNFSGCGALQAAIDRVRAESDLDPWLMSGDLVKFLGNRMTTRSDTFLVRAYGDACRPGGEKILATARLEVLLQHMPDGSFRCLYFRWL